jgi:DNA-binding SARP family transcriptional activator
MPAPARIELYLLGGIDLRRDDGADASGFVAQTRPLALLAYLTIAGPRPGTFHRRDRLVGLFWPETDQERARANLRQLVRRIRDALGDDVIETRGDEELRIAPGVLWCDVLELEDAAARGRLARADELYGGELLPGFHLTGTPAPEFDRWLSARRMQLAERATDVVFALAMRSHGQHMTESLRWWRRLAQLTNDERMFRRAVQMLADAGDKLGAIMAYDAFERRLAAMDMLPSQETRDLIEKIRRR